MKSNENLRQLFEDTVIGLAFQGYFETNQKTTWHRLLRRESDDSEIFVSVIDPRENHADTPIIIRFKGQI